MVSPSATKRIGEECDSVALSFDNIGEFFDAFAQLMSCIRTARFWISVYHQHTLTLRYAVHAFRHFVDISFKTVKFLKCGCGQLCQRIAFGRKALLISIAHSTGRAYQSEPKYVNKKPFHFHYNFKTVQNYTLFVD